MHSVSARACAGVRKEDCANNAQAHCATRSTVCNHNELQTLALTFRDPKPIVWQTDILTIQRVLPLVRAHHYSISYMS